MSIQDSICTAIRGHYLLSLSYNDDAYGIRIVEPYTLGYNKAGHLILNGWFRVGASASQEGAGFRDYLIEKIGTLEIMKERFTQPMPLYVAGGGRKFQSVLCDVAFG